MDERNCTIEELYDNKHSFQYSKGLHTQIRKMYEEHRYKQLKKDMVKNMTYKITRGHKFPIIFCKEYRDQWYFYCPFCKENHYHDPGEEPHVAHCRDLDSPFRRTGYYLKLQKRMLSK